MSTQPNVVSGNVKPNGQLSELEQLKIQLAAAEAKVKEMETAATASISYKCRAAGEKYTDGTGKEQVGKGCLSMYGLGKFPVSLFESQWQRVISEVKSGRLEAQLKLNAAKLAHKS